MGSRILGYGVRGVEGPGGQRLGGLEGRRLRDSKGRRSVIIVYSYFCRCFYEYISVFGL